MARCGARQTERPRFEEASLNQLDALGDITTVCVLAILVLYPARLIDSTERLEISAVPSSPGINMPAGHLRDRLRMVAKAKGG